MGADEAFLNHNKFEDLNDNNKNIEHTENWSKVVHVKSSLSRKKGQYAMFIGRFQPLHEGHIKLFSQAIDEGKNVLICVRDGEVDQNNPFSAEEVKNKIEAHYTFINVINEKSGLPTVKVMVIPDICSVEFGRGVGYDIIEHIPPKKINDISATKIREEMRKKGDL